MGLENWWSRSNAKGRKASQQHENPHSREATADLAQEVTELEAQKSRLLQEIAELQSQRQFLQARPGVISEKAKRQEAYPIPLEFPAAPLPLRSKLPQLPLTQVGLWLIILSTVTLSIHNVIVRIIIGTPIEVFGLFALGGFIQPSVGNSLLILWMRMLVVLPLMITLAGFIYPAVWKDIKRLLLDCDRRPLINVIGSGGFLFLSQVLIYIAIGQIGPGIAVTILFMYPLVTVPLAWWLFGDRPTRLRIAVMVVILLGVLFAALPKLSKASAIPSGGVFTAALAGVAFAFYLVFMQLGFKKLHPVPVSVVQFVTILLLSSVSLCLPLSLGVSLQPDQRVGLLVGGLALGALTLVGYLSNNFGVRLMGAARASIIASSGPAMTAVLAAIILQSRLEQVQVFGILLVTIGVTALSFERMQTMNKAKPKPNK